jgi:transposase
MLGHNPSHSQESLFSYHVSLERRLSPDHPLRTIHAALDLSFIIPAVRPFYGRSGHVSLDPRVIVKLMFLLFYYNIPSERELMEQLSYRLDFLWFLDFSLETGIPDHSVLSKARARWGPGVFEDLFVRSVGQCVAAGLVDGRLLHADSTVVKANAGKDSVSALPAFLAECYRAQERKLEPLPAAPAGGPAPAPAPASAAVEVTVYDPAQSPAPAPSPCGPVPQLQVLPPPLVPAKPVPATASREQLVSTTDPDAQFTRAKNGLVELSYKEHRVVDDAHGVITVVAVTTAQVHDGTQLPALLGQHRQNTGLKRADVSVAGDSHYGMVDNYRFCHQQGIGAHLAPARAHLEEKGKFTQEHFVYDPQADAYRCPAGQLLTLRRKYPQKRQRVYSIAPRQGCAQCPLREKCTTAKEGRTLVRHDDQELIDQQRRQAMGPAARYSRKRRKHMMEGSFAQAANEHGLKQARWRRIWRQKIQSCMICLVQNIRLLTSRRIAGGKKGAAVLKPERLKGVKNLLGGGNWLRELIFRPSHPSAAFQPPKLNFNRHPKISERHLEIAHLGNTP